jgi:hypothetical protein
MIVLTCCYCSKKYNIGENGIPIGDNGVPLKELGMTAITGATEKNNAPRTQKMFKCPECGYSTRIPRGKVGLETLSPNNDPLVGFGRETVYPQILNG